MPRLVNIIPSYRLHKASGQALVTLNGEDVYLGAHDTAASKKEYDCVIGEWLARGRQRLTPAANVRVADVIKAYWDFARKYYPDPQGEGECRSIKLALSLLRRLYGQTPAREFGPLALQTVRQQMVKERAWSRGYVNGQIARIKRCFKWAASQELVAHLPTTGYRRWPDFVVERPRLARRSR